MLCLLPAGWAGSLPVSTAVVQMPRHSCPSAPLGASVCRTAAGAPGAVQQSTGPDPAAAQRSTGSWYHAAAASPAADGQPAGEGH